MKSLTQILNESLQGITTQQYKGIWQGNFDVNLNEDHLSNPIYFFTELLYAHKQSLPTTEEFTNVCKFIATKMKNADKQLLENHFNLFTKRFVEIYFPDVIRGSISGSTRNSFDNMKLWDISSNDGGSLAGSPNKLKFEIYIHAVFFGKLYLNRADKQSANNMWKSTIDKLGKKYKLTAENWPDYSIGVGIIRDAIKH